MFDEFGIPLAMEGGRPLRHRAGSRPSRCLLRLEFDDWPYRQLLQVLGSNYFRPAWPECPCRGRPAKRPHELVRSLQVPVGARAFSIRRPKRAETQGTPQRRPRPLGLKLLRRWRRRLMLCPSEPPPRLQWGAALHTLAAEMGLSRWMTSEADDGKWPAEGRLGRGAGRVRHPASGWAMARKLGPRKLDRHEFWEFWQDMLQSEPCRKDGTRWAACGVLSATSARRPGGTDRLLVWPASASNRSRRAGGQGLLSEGEVAGLIPPACRCRPVQASKPG